jgi:HEAT repeat protein
MNATAELRAAHLAELVQDLRDPQPANRLSAAQAVAEQAEEGHAAAGALLQAALHDEDGGVRLAAAIALAKIGGRPATVLPLLIDVLEDEIDPARRWLAADALRDLGPTAAPAAPALARALRRPVERPLVRQSIRMALNALRPAA